MEVNCGRGETVKGRIVSIMAREGRVRVACEAVARRIEIVCRFCRGRMKLA